MCVVSFGIETHGRCVDLVLLAELQEFSHKELELRNLQPLLSPNLFLKPSITGLVDLTTRIYSSSLKHSHALTRSFLSTISCD